MFRAIYDLLNALSRIPGLSFLRGIARSFYDADRTQKNIERAGKAAKNLQEKVSGKDEEEKSS
jgi:hypothetical protein